MTPQRTVYQHLGTQRPSVKRKYTYVCSVPLTPQRIVYQRFVQTATCQLSQVAHLLVHALNHLTVGSYREVVGTFVLYNQESVLSQLGVGNVRVFKLNEKTVRFKWVFLSNDFLRYIRQKKSDWRLLVPFYMNTIVLDQSCVG